MKLKFKMTLIGILLLCAVFSAAFSTINYVKTEKDNKTVECMAESNVENYVLREYKGYVAIYMENDTHNPITVTDIQVSTLRELDRMLLQTGMKLASRERLMMTLEDLGS